MKLNISHKEWKEIRQQVEAVDGKGYKGKITNLLRNRRFNLEAHLSGVRVMDAADVRFWGVLADSNS
jgi:Na+-translocating ferredoxin:NAD+ oxidoreductase RnfG subunit